MNNFTMGANGLSLMESEFDVNTNLCYIDLCYNFMPSNFGLDSLRPAFYHVSSEETLPLPDHFVLKAIPSTDLEGLTAIFPALSESRLCILMNGCPDKTLVYLVEKKDLDSFFNSVEKDPDKHIRKYNSSDVRDFNVLSISSDYNQFFNHIMRNPLFGIPQFFEKIAKKKSNDRTFYERYGYILSSVSKLENLLNKVDDTRFCKSSDFDLVEEIIDQNYGLVKQMAHDLPEGTKDYYDCLKDSTDRMFLWKDILKKACNDKDVFKITSEILSNDYGSFIQKNDYLEDFLRYIYHPLPTSEGYVPFINLIPEKSKTQVLYAIFDIVFSEDKNTAKEKISHLYNSRVEDICYLDSRRLVQ